MHPCILADTMDLTFKKTNPCEACLVESCTIFRVGIVRLGAAQLVCCAASVALGAPLMWLNQGNAWAGMGCWMALPVSQQRLAKNPGKVGGDWRTEGTSSWVAREEPLWVDSSQGSCMEVLFAIVIRKNNKDMVLVTTIRVGIWRWQCNVRMPDTVFSPKRDKTRDFVTVRQCLAASDCLVFGADLTRYFGLLLCFGFFEAHPHSYSKCIYRRQF